MAFQDSYRTTFTNRSTTDTASILGTAAPYGVQIEPASAQAGQQCWRAIGVHHLTPSENRGGHAVYVDVVDEDGNKIRNPNVRLSWGEN